MKDRIIWESKWDDAVVEGQIFYGADGGLGGVHVEGGGVDVGGSVS